MQSFVYEQLAHRVIFGAGTLDRLATEAVAVDAGGAGTIVIGDVVAIGLQEAGIEFPIEALCQ